MSEVVYDDNQGDLLGWHNVDIDHYGIEAGELRDGLWPVRGLTIRIKFDSDSLPSAVWWYAELNESERYVEPPVGSPRRLDVVCGDVIKTFERPCQPRESYGIAYRWSPGDGRSDVRKVAGPSVDGPAIPVGRCVRQRQLPPVLPPPKFPPVLPSRRVIVCLPWGACAPTSTLVDCRHNDVGWEKPAGPQAGHPRVRGSCGPDASPRGRWPGLVPV